MDPFFLEEQMRRYMITLDNLVIATVRANNGRTMLVIVGIFLGIVCPTAAIVAITILLAMVVGFIHGRTARGVVALSYETLSTFLIYSMWGSAFVELLFF